MTYDNLFEGAVRAKYRFPFKGQISVEDLWDLSVQDLDKIFKLLNNEAKKSKEESLLQTRDENDEILDRKIEIVKHIVFVKQAEYTAIREAADKKARKQHILEIIDKKKDDALQNMSLEELQRLAENL